jgi:hypothetical protein
MGFFKKIQSCDKFVFLDDVQYERSDWDNRNKIRTFDGSMWLTIPVHNKFGQKLNEVKISYETNWQNKHRKSIELNYRKAPYFEKYWKEIDKILETKWEKLIDLNFALIAYVMSQLDITTETIRSSQMGIETVGSQRLLDMCKKLQATTYISGEMGKDYLDETIFDNNKIKVIYENFQHPVYNQIHGEFIPNMSIIDLLFNEGENSQKILKMTKNF